MKEVAEETNDGEMKNEANSDIDETVKDDVMTVNSIIAYEDMEVSDRMFSSGYHLKNEEHVPSHKQWARSTLPTFGNDSYMDTFYHDQPAEYRYTLRKDFGLMEDVNVAYKNEFTTATGQSTRGKINNRDALEILQEVEELKAATYALNTVYKNLQIEIKYFKKFMKDEISLIYFKGEIPHY